jgi:predicted ArsR family transcriptional regulator
MANYVKVNAMSYAKMIALLLDEDHSKREIAKKTGLHYLTACEYMTELHKAGAIYVADFRTDRLGRRTTKAYRIGSKPDAEAKPMTGSEKARRYRKRSESLERMWPMKDHA